VRIVILGPGAAGKSTFARRLSEGTGVQAIELDSVFWSDDLKPLAPEDWIKVQTELIADESWILDGDLGPHDVLKTRLERADTVVMFDPPTVKCVWRALRRSREQREFWVWLLTWRRREKQRLLAAIELHAPTARFEMVTTDDDVERLLSQMS
jgi:adenylate kinase family enzyme